MKKVLIFLFIFFLASANCHKYFVKHIVRTVKASGSPATGTGEAGVVASGVSEVSSEEAIKETIETAYDDEIEINLLGKADDTCKIDYLNLKSMSFISPSCKVGSSTDLTSPCKMPCNSKITFELPSGKSHRYIRVIEGSEVKIMTIPIEITKISETKYTLGAEIIKASVKRFCNSEIDCELRTEENNYVIDKIGKDECNNDNLTLQTFVGYSPKHTYYTYCGPTQPKVYFFTQTSFYNDIKKVRNIPFTVKQDTTTKTNFILSVDDPLLKNELCLFSIKKSDSNYEDKCVATGENKCYKYCYGKTILKDSSSSGDKNNYEVKITTRYGKEEYKIDNGKNTVTISEITQTTAKVTVTSPSDSKKCFYKLFYAYMPTLGETKICGKGTDNTCSETCSDGITLKDLKPSTSYILQLSVQTSSSDASDAKIVNKLFTTSGIEYEQAHMIYTDNGIIVKARATNKWRKEIKDQICFIQYYRTNTQTKTIAKCENGQICRGKCSETFFVIDLPKNTEIQVELVEDSDLKTVIRKITHIFKSKLENPVSSQRYEYSEKTLYVIPSKKHKAYYCDVVIFAKKTEDDAKNSHIFGIKGRSTGDNLRCDKEIAFKNAPNGYDFSVETKIRTTDGERSILSTKWWIFPVLGLVLVGFVGLIIFSKKKKESD